MNTSGFRVASVFVVLCAGAFAQTPAKTVATDDFKNEALVLERYEMSYRMHADGTGERVNHVVAKIQSEGAARQFGVLSFAYASADETPHIDMVRVHKADGSVVDTPVADAIDMPAAVTREAPLYSDLKEKHLPVRSLSAGDTLEYEVHMTIDKAEAPGQFWGAHHFTAPGSLVVRAEVLTVEVPKDKYVQVWSPNHKPVITEHDGVRSYVWNVAQLEPTPKGPAPGEDKRKSKKKPVKDPDEDADGHTLPSVAWTTFHSWSEVGDWYRGLSAGRAEANDALRARAKEITKDAKTDEERVRAIYGFVSTRTRYVGIDFGVGRYQPHTAAEVLANQYGDCKDKDTLLEALLHAEGFKTAPALIGAGITPVADVPSPATFNHVITTVNLPEGRIWLDSTPEVAPYRYLSETLRDQLALVIPAEGASALEKTPAEPPYPLESRFEATGTLSADGKFVGQMLASFRTDVEVYVRTMARNVAPAESDKVSQFISSASGFGGTTSDTHFLAVDDLSKPIGISYQYTRQPYGDWDNQRIIPPFPVVEFHVLDSDSEEPDEDIALGSPGKAVAVAHVRLPEGYHADVPDPVHVKTDFATFDKTYQFDGKEITVERTVVVLKKKLPKAEWKKYQTFLKDASLQSEPWIQLIRPLPKGTVTVTTTMTPKTGTKAGAKTTAKVNGKEVEINKAVVAVAPSSTSTPAAAAPIDVPANASSQDLLQAAGERFIARDVSGATALLDRVKAKDPDHENLWAMYGAIATMQRKKEEAEEDFRKELAKYPDNERAVGALADVENRNGEQTDAEKTLSGYLDRHPEDLKLSLYLASIETASDDNEGALKTLQKAAEKNPEDRSLRVELSRSYLRLDRRDEAAAVAKSALDGTDDPMVLNNAADVLAEAGLDLSDAEEASLKSIHALEEKSASITTAEANSTSFKETTLLISAWDTLGWISFRQGKLDAAKPLIEASWRNGLQRVVGDHLGQLYEAMGRKDEALNAYLLASASSERGSGSKEADKHIAESVARLKKDGAKTNGKDAHQVLQDSRSYKMTGPAGMSGWGTFRMQITASGVIGSRQMSGEQKLADLAKEIDAMKFPELLPPDSKAHLLRSAVVSCSSNRSCDVILVPNSSLMTESY